MQVVYERCCGLDVHKKMITACLIVPGPDGKAAKELRRFGTMTPDLLQLQEWLVAKEVTHVALESTGISVRRFTARAIPPAGRAGSGGNPRAND